MPNGLNKALFNMAKFSADTIGSQQISLFKKSYHEKMFDFYNSFSGYSFGAT